MTLKNINPTTTASWNKLTNHFKDIKNIRSGIKKIILKIVIYCIFTEALLAMLKV